MQMASMLTGLNATYGDKRLMREGWETSAREDWILRPENVSVS